jgi:hypothetical protein
VSGAGTASNAASGNMVLRHIKTNTKSTHAISATQIYIERCAANDKQFSLMPSAGGENCLKVPMAPQRPAVLWLKAFGYLVSAQAA